MKKIYLLALTILGFASISIAQTESGSKQTELSKTVIYDASGVKVSIYPSQCNGEGVVLCDVQNSNATAVNVAIFIKDCKPGFANARIVQVESNNTASGNCEKPELLINHTAGNSLPSLEVKIVPQ